MSPRTGRPTNNPKNMKMPVRLSEDDVSKLEYCAKKTGKSKAEVIRIGIDKVYKETKEKE